MNLAERIIKLEEAVRKLLTRPFIYYNKGTYTPTYQGGTTAGATTYTLQTGNWTRKGREITVTGQIVWTAATGTGNAQISLPFPVATGNATGSLRLSAVTFANSAPEITALVGSSFFTMDSPLTNAAPTTVAMEAAGNIVFTITYMM